MLGGSSISQAEYSEVVYRLFDGRALGVDEICPEYLKSLGVVGMSWRTRLCSIAWQSGRVCSNIRGITLLSFPGKIYSWVMKRRIRPILKPWIQREHCVQAGVCACACLLQ